MSTISTHLRNFKEPTKDQLTQLFFALPSASTGNGTDMNGGPSASPAGEKGAASPQENELEKMEINAVLSLGIQGEEDSYVSRVASSRYPHLWLWQHVRARARG